MTIPMIKTVTRSKNGCVMSKSIFEKAIEEWKEKGMPSIEMIHKD